MHTADPLCVVGREGSLHTPAHPPPPSELLERWAPQAPRGPALDLGAGQGEAARWLETQGFEVEAVEADPVRFRRLAAGGSSRLHAFMLDLQDFVIQPGRYALILASAVLHFLRPSQLWTLADRLQAGLTHGGLLLVEVFTTDDPGCASRRAEGAPEVEPNTFLAREPVGLIHYFEPGELLRLFPALEVLAYEESRRLDPGAPEGYRSGAQLVARRP